MRLSYLRLFCDLARCRSFSEAALLNDVTQSAASQVVLQLEKRLGLRLVDRSTRPLQLTPEGQSFYDGCRVLIAQYDELEASLRRSRPRPNRVDIVAIYSVGLRDMNQYVARFQPSYPDHVVHIEYLHPDRVYERVREGRADFGLVSYPRKSRDLMAFSWKQEEMLLACSPAHPLASRQSVAVAELQGLKYIGFDRDLVIRRHIDRFLKQHHLNVDIVLEFDTIENVKKGIEESEGVALLPEPMLRKEVRAGILAAVPLSDATLLRPLGIIVRRDHSPTRAARYMMQLLREPEPEAGMQPETGKRVLAPN
jgi:DNA-binding transcriptional LysR family regulator